MLKARRAEHDQQRIGASPASDTNSRNDTSCDATTRDDNIGNDYSRSTSSEPPPDVKRARQRTRTLQVCQRSSSFGLRPRIETGDPSGARAKKGQSRFGPPKATTAAGVRLVHRSCPGVLIDFMSYRSSRLPLLSLRHLHSESATFVRGSPIKKTAAEIAVTATRLLGVSAATKVNTARR
jgi:hypothetical protein